jgi:uncharacterized cupredoxin-like copper-binding protein
MTTGKSLPRDEDVAVRKRLVDRLGRPGHALVAVALAALVFGVISASAAISRGAADSEIAVTMGKPGEFSLKSSVRSAKAGEVVLVVRNKGKIVHEFIVLRTPIKAAALKARDTDAQKVVEPGFLVELEDMEPGDRVGLVMPLKKGHYVLLCNVAGHYAAGMRADLTLK